MKKALLIIMIELSNFCNAIEIFSMMISKNSLVKSGNSDSSD